MRRIANTFFRRVAAGFLMFRAGLLSLGFALALPGEIAAQEMEVPVSMQMSLFIKVMSFDRSLELPVGSPFIVAIAYQSGFRTSVIAKDEAVRILQELPDDGLGRRISVTTNDLDKVAPAAGLAMHNPCALYVAPLRAVNIEELAAVAAAAQVTTLTGVPRYVSLGIAVGVRLQGDRPKLMINVSASRNQGARFSSELLKLAQVTP